jgi:hypothetical protein
MGDYKTVNLIDGEILAIEDLELLRECDEVKNLLYGGQSSNRIGFYWYEVILKNGEEYVVHTEEQLK